MDPTYIIAQVVYTFRQIWITQMNHNPASERSQNSSAYSPTYIPFSYHLTPRGKTHVFRTSPELLGIKQ